MVGFHFPWDCPAPACVGAVGFSSNGTCHFLGGPPLGSQLRDPQKQNTGRGGLVAQGCGFAISLVPRPLTGSSHSPLQPPLPQISQPLGASGDCLVRSVASWLDFAGVSLIAGHKLNLTVDPPLRCWGTFLKSVLRATEKHISPACTAR